MMSMLINKSTSFDIVTEAYYGKPKEFKTIEKELDKVISAIKGELNESEPGNAISNDNINNSDSVVLIEKLLKKVFKVKDVNVTFYTSLPTGKSLRMGYNAYAAPKALTVIHRTSKDNMRAKSEDLLVNISVDKMLIAYANLSSEEILALMLHEIGHSFDASYFTMMSRILPSVGLQFDGSEVKFSIVNVANTIKGIIFSQVGYHHFVTKINKFLETIMEKIPYLNKILMTTSNIVHSIRKCLYNISIPDPRVVLYYMVQPSNVFGYAGEKYADSFATAYGYGNALSTALIKLDKDTGIIGVAAIRKVPVVGIMYNFLEYCGGLTRMLADPHPQTAIRILSQLKKLERDLNDPDIPPVLKKEIKQQIDEQKKIIENFTDPSYVENTGRIYSVIWNKTLIDLFDGKLDPREIVERVIQHEE